MQRDLLESWRVAFPVAPVMRQAGGMDAENSARKPQVTVNRRRKELVCISCPNCSGAVPVLARLVEGELEPVLDCRTCGWTRPARREGDD
jgi:RNase P subunit RPR2